jgi:hypothetical protein
MNQRRHVSVVLEPASFQLPSGQDQLLVQLEDLVVATLVLLLLLGSFGF